MTLHLTTVVAKDGAGNAIPSGVQQHDSSGTGAGPNDPVAVLIDSTGAEVLGTTADAAYTGSGSAGVVAALKGIYAKLAGSIAVTGTFFQATQPVSASSLPLPTGAALEAGGNLATLAGAISSAKMATKSADGDHATIGVTTGTAVITDAAGTMQQYLRGLVKLIAGSLTVTAPSSAPIPVKSRYVNAVTTTLTRPANTTAYSANDSISDNATAGSVTALSATVSDNIGDPICLTEILVDTTDTGLAAAISIRAYLFDADPTANTGVGAGDNAAYSQKRAGFLGSMSGTFRPFSDGGKARLTPDEGSYIIANPASGAETVYIQYQTLGAFTPSGSSTTLIGRIKGFQGRA